jgi:hypothetical protein
MWVYDDFPSSMIDGREWLRRASARCRRRKGTLQQGKEGYFMAKNNSSNDEPRPAAIEKKPYQKPGFRYEQVFVTSALSCGKITSTQSGCSLNTKVS